MMGKANFTSSLTIMSTHKNPRKSIAGCYVIHAFIFTSLPLAVPGSTWSSVSSLAVHCRGHSPGKTSFRCDNSKPPLMPTSQNVIKTRTLLLGCLCQIPSLGNSRLPFLN